MWQVRQTAGESRRIAVEKNCSDILQRVSAIRCMFIKIPTYCLFVRFITYHGSSYYSMNIYIYIYVTIVYAIVIVVLIVVVIGSILY